VNSILDNASIGNLNVRDLGLIVIEVYHEIILLILNEPIVILILHVHVIHEVIIIAKKSISLLVKVNAFLLSLLEVGLEIAK
jgi:hypothetical protein